MKSIGAERLESYRDKHGYKQYELAELLELAEAHLSQLLTGKRRPGLPIAVRIEQRTGVPAESWLLHRVGKSKKAGTKGDDSDGIRNEEAHASRS